MKKETNPLQILLIVVLCVIGAIVAMKLLSFAFAVLISTSVMMWVFMPFLVIIAIVLLALNLFKKK